MKIKTVSGNYREVEETPLYDRWADQQIILVSWADIKPIIEEYQAAIENTQVGCSDYGLMGNAMLEDED